MLPADVRGKAVLASLSRPKGFDWENFKIKITDKKKFIEILNIAIIDSKIDGTNF